MPKYIIERDISGLGDWSIEQLREASQKSCQVLAGMGPSIEWINSFVTANKMFCIYEANTERQVYEHATISGFPADHIYEVKSVIGPFTAE
ncbi:MAG: DUF4242 domain-containing protein [Acidobacteriota bacterium]